MKRIWRNHSLCGSSDVVL